jgi:diguanylate cyclase (GGDEF)-like protein
LDASAPAGVTVEPAAGRIAELASEHGLGFTWLAVGGSQPRTDGGGDSGAALPNVALCVFVGPKRFLTASERTGVIRAVELATAAVALHEKVVAAGDRATADTLTGVLAREPFFDALEAAARPVTLMLVHVGGIAAVNSAHGYEAGDAALRAVALALQNVVRRRDIVGRLSGATFAVAGPSRGADRQADRWADRVREAVRTRLVVAGRVLEPACRVTHVIGPSGSGAAEIVLQAEAQLRGSVTGITDRNDAASGRRFEDR